MGKNNISKFNLKNSNFFIIRYNSLNSKEIQKSRLICERNGCKIIFTKNCFINLFFKSLNFKEKYKNNNFIVLVKKFFILNEIFDLNLLKKNLNVVSFYSNFNIIKGDILNSLLFYKNKINNYLYFFIILKKNMFLFKKYLTILKNEKSKENI